MSEQVTARWLGWAGVEVTLGGESVVIDPLLDPAAVFAPLGREADGALPEVVAANSKQSAHAAFLTHLHRDHADATALADQLSEDGVIYEPEFEDSGDPTEDLGLAQAQAELGRLANPRRQVSAWETAEAGPFRATAVPAVDGLGDPQLSWVLEAGGTRLLHLGDSIFHGYWWRIAQRHGPFDIAFAPINGAVINFPHRPSAAGVAAVMDPEEAALAGELLGAERVVPMHYKGFDVDPYYRPVDDAEARFREAAAGRPYEAVVLETGEEIGLDRRE